MFSVAIISLAAIIWLFTWGGKSKFIHHYAFYALIPLIFIGLLAIPMLEGHSVINLLYSFFDSPSYLCVIWALLFIGKVGLHGLFKINPSAALTVSPISVLILFIIGGLYYCSALGFFPLNLHYVSSLSQAVITLTLCLVIFLFDKTLFIMLVLSLIPFAFFNPNNLTIFEFILCPYLWIYCGVKSIGTVVMLSLSSIKQWLPNAKIAIKR